MPSDNSKRHPEVTDEQFLFRRKDKFSGYKHCPLCSNELKEHTIDNTARLVCSNSHCDFVYYHNPAPAAGAIVVKDEKILLVKRAHFPRKDFWCFPSGFMEWDEHPSQTALREIEEETGLKIEITELFNVYSGVDDPHTNAILVLYLAKEIGGRLSASDDASEAAYFAMDDIPEDIAFEAHRQAIGEFKNNTGN